MRSAAEDRRYAATQGIAGRVQEVYGFRPGYDSYVLPAAAGAVLLSQDDEIAAITPGWLNLGTWQGIHLCEDRDRSGQRRVVVTACGK